MRALLLPLVFAALALLAPRGPALSEERAAPKKRLEVRDLYGGPSFTKGIPGWSWRPGHPQLVRRTSPKDADGKSRSVLVGLAPESGKTEEILDLGALRELVPGKGNSMRGIGRGGPRRFEWADGGKALCAVVKGDLVWVDLESGRRRKLTATKERLADLNIAPDGSHVSFSRGNELWVVPTEKGKPYPLTTGSSKTLLNATLDWVYPEEFGFRSAAWWAPDARHLAYLQMDQAKVPVYRVPGLLPKRSAGREMFYPKAGDPNPRVRLGVVPVGGGETVWLDLGEPAPEYIVRVAWTPDSECVLVVTLDRAQRHLRLHACPLDGGKGVVAHEERDAAWIDVPPAPKWVSDTQFLWRRQTDCTRWYLGTLAPGSAKVEMEPITPVGMDASSILHFDPATGRGYCSGTAHGTISAGVFEVGAGRDRAPARFTGDQAGLTSTAKLDESGSYALVSVSNAVTPTRTTLVRVADGQALREIGDARSKRLDSLALAVPEYGQIPLEDLGRINWRLWKPADFDPSRRYGLIVQVYAGPGSRMTRDTWGRGPLLHTLLTQRGFLVLQVDGRGSGGQGRDFMKCVQGRLGLLELEDQVRAVKEITARPYVDERRVGIWGWSYGGTMACNALTMRSDVFRAGVAVASVTDWQLYDTIYTERYMGTPKENPEGYKQTASVNHAGKMTGHLLLMHGMGDDNVHAQNTMRLVEAFIKAKNLNYDAMIFPRRGHGIGGASLDVFTRLVRHFETHLR